MAKSTYLANLVLNWLLNGTDPGAVVPWVSLHSADPGLDGANELSGNNYGRVNASACFPAAALGVCANDAIVQFPVPSGAWTTATHFGLWDAETVGNFLRGAALTAPRTGTLGADVEFPVGNLEFNED
jgi:hypothetical protein